MKERTKFLLEWERRWDAGEGVVNVSELCRQFGISRDTGHRLIARYQPALAASHGCRFGGSSWVSAPNASRPASRSRTAVRSASVER